MAALFAFWAACSDRVSTGVRNRDAAEADNHGSQVAGNLRHRMPRGAEFKAAAVHLFTASGSVCAVFAVLATIERQPERAFLWLGVALLIDGIDGYFARRFRVKQVLSSVSGEVLDLCVDYVTYVFVPALILLLGPMPGALGMTLAAIICVTSLYHFADTTSKTEDHCFVGFPAIWNIVVFYILALALPQWAIIALVLVCAGLTFVRWKWVHPMRVTAFRGVTLALTAVWAVAACDVLWRGFPAGWLSGGAIVLVAIYGVALSVYFSRRASALG